MGVIIRQIFLNIIFFFVFIFPTILNAEFKTFRVGVSVPLSGAFVEFGEAVINGIEKAKADRPDLFSNLKFIYEDNSYDSKQAITTVQKFIDIDNVNLIFMWGVEPCRATSPIAESRKVPMVATTQLTDVSAGNFYVVRFLNSGQEYSDTMLAYFQSQNIKNIAILQTELSFFNMLVDGLKVGNGNVKIRQINSVLPQDLDFKTEILKLKRLKFEILGVYLTPPQVKSFFKEANTLNYHPPVFGATTFESKSLLSDSWPLMEGAVFTHNTVIDEFVRSYSDKYGNDIQIAYAANAYDFAILTAQLFGKLEASLESNEVIKAYANTKVQSGASGDYHFKETSSDGKYFSFDIVVKKISKGVSKEIFRNRLGSVSKK